MNKRFIYDEGKPEGAKVEEQKGSEKKEVTSDDVNKAKENFMAEKQAFEKKLDGYLKSENPVIKKAAEDAKADLKRFDGDTDLTADALQSHINYIKGAIYYFENKPKIDSNVKKIEAKAETLSRQWSDYFKNTAKGYIESNPFLPPEAVARINTLADEHADMMDGAINVQAILGTMTADGNSVSDFTFEQFLLDPAQMNTIFDNLRNTFARLDGTDKGAPLWAEIDRIGTVLDQKINAVINIEIGKDIDLCNQTVEETRDGGIKNLDDWGKENNKDVSEKKVALLALCDNAINTLKLMNKPDDAKKRAVIVANLDDQIHFLFSGKKDQREGVLSSVDQILEFTKSPKDTYSSGFENGKTIPADASLKLDEKVKKTDEYFSISGNPNFRLEGSGSQMLVLKPNSVVQVVDSQVMQIETSSEGKVNYIKVRLNPPNGPVGYVALNHVNLQKPIVQPGTKSPDAHKQQQA